MFECANIDPARLLDLFTRDNTAGMDSAGRRKLRSWLDSSDTCASELARALGVARSLVSQWRSGTRTPSRTNANKLAKVTGGAVPATSWDEPFRSRPRRPRAA